MRYEIEKIRLSVFQLFETVEKFNCHTILTIFHNIYDSISKLSFCSAVYLFKASFKVVLFTCFSGNMLNLNGSKAFFLFYLKEKNNSCVNLTKFWLIKCKKLSWASG